ncbi:MAG: response regulator [Nitrosarchaeum sp.]|nr:MAG: response regulator [Nitrosarchaeum sp.]
MVNCIVVDDNQDIVDVFCELLNLIGLDVLAKGMNGMDAVKLYKKYRPDLIFVDLIMPKYDGFYAIENIKDADPNARIVVITGDVKTCESDLLDSLKVIAVIYKPFDVQKIKQIVVDVFLD